MQKLDDVIINKTESIRRCVEGAREDYFSAREDFLTNFMRQNSAILNMQRGCEQAIDLATYIITLLRLGAPSETRDVFLILSRKQIISDDLAQRMCQMVGFRNTIVHEYQKIDLKIVIAVIQKNLDDLLEFAELVLKQHDKIKFLEEVVLVDYSDEKKAEESSIELIESCFNYYAANKNKVAELLNIWRRLKIIAAINSISGNGTPKMFRACLSQLSMFFEEEKNISPSLSNSPDIAMQDNDIINNISILRKRIQK